MRTRNRVTNVHFRNRKSDSSPLALASPVTTNRTAIVVVLGLLANSRFEFNSKILHIPVLVNSSVKRWEMLVITLWEPSLEGLAEANWLWSSLDELSTLSPRSQTHSSSSKEDNKVC